VRLSQTGKHEVADEAQSFRLEVKIYQSALKAAYKELVKLHPQPLAA
jgi:hypothetical protein